MAVPATAGWNAKLKRWPGWFVLALAAIALVVVGATTDRGARQPSERADALERRLACPVCDGESIFESRNQAAVNIRNEIESLVNEGRLTDTEIIARIDARGTDSLVLLPQTDGIDVVVWVLPVAAFVAGAAGLVVVFRRWKAASATDAAPTDDDRALVAAALDESADDGTRR